MKQFKFCQGPARQRQAIKSNTDEVDTTSTDEAKAAHLSELKSLGISSSDIDKAEGYG
jgi:hypothetical protein